MNQYTTTQEGGNPPVGYIYDENGDFKTDNTTDIWYDFKNRPVETRQTQGGALLAQLSYDPLNRRLLKVTSTGTTAFAFDGFQCVEERDGTNAITRQYVWGPGVDELLQQQTPTATYYSHENAIGSVCALTDQTGAVVERYQYDPFGNTTVTLNGNTGNPYRFHSAYFDADTGFVDMRNRYYWPKLGRFLQRDPIGVWGSGVNFGNGLAFPGNNPLFWRDPLGRDGYLEDVAATLGGYVQGIGEGLQGAAEGVAGALSDPVGTVQEIGSAFQNVWGNMPLTASNASRSETGSGRSSGSTSGARGPTSSYSSKTQPTPTTPTKTRSDRSAPSPTRPRPLSSATATTLSGTPPSP